MVELERLPLAGLGEVDEASLLQRTKTKSPGSGPGRTRRGKMPIVGALELRDGKPGRMRLCGHRRLFGSEPARLCQQQHRPPIARSRATPNPAIPAPRRDTTSRITSGR